MALHFELVSPEKLLFSGDVNQVDVPGAEGDFGVLEGHAPTVATLRPGIVTVRRAGRRASSCSAASPRCRRPG
jgi:F-type H+-transporting ATPase subunit epsilon